jgi:two-component system chemotaxis response regulator CheY
MPPGPKLEDLCVMVVEDDSFTRSLIKTVLRNMGVRTIHEADSATLALEMLATAAIDVIVSDIQMSPIDGLQFLRHLRAGTRPAGVVPPQAPPSQIPVIFLTAHAQVKLVEQARAAGVSAFLTKPIRPTLLRERLLSVAPLVRRPEKMAAKPAADPSQSASDGQTQQLEAVASAPVGD